MLAAFGVPATTLMQDAAADTPRIALAPDAKSDAAKVSQDPTVIAPKSYRVLYENDRVRVLEYSNRPGLGACGRGRHYHPAHLDIFFTDFTARITSDEGKVSHYTPRAGQVAWFEAEWHEVENIDKTATKAIMVELKDAHWKPSTD